MSLDRPTPGLPPVPPAPPLARPVPPAARRVRGEDGEPRLPVTAVPDGARPDGYRPAGMAPVPTPEGRMLPPHQSKLDRVTGHLAALSVDLREWTELRVELVKRQVEGVQAQLERFQHYADAAGLLLPAAVLALTALFFLIVTLALGIGALVGSVWLGFLITTVLLLVGAAAFAWAGLRRVRVAQRLAAEARERDREGRDRSVDELRESQATSVRNASV